MNKKILTLGGFSDKHSAKIIKNSLKEFKQIKNLRFNVVDGEIEIFYDKKLNFKEVIDNIENQGYDVL